MKTIKQEAPLGGNIRQVSEKAKQTAINCNAVVEFDFNGILCKVSESTNIDNLLRDYGNAHLMDWKTIPHSCLNEYPRKLKESIAEKMKEQAEKHKKETEAYRKKETEDKIAFQKSIEGTTFAIKDVEKYNIWKANNKDGYSAVIFEYAECWGRMLQTKLGEPDLKKVFDDFDLQPNYLNISGYQHGAAKTILKRCWMHADTFNL